jgi:hypothetical protein
MRRRIKGTMLACARKELKIYGSKKQFSKT